MAQNQVKINQGDGGLGRELPTLDHVTALLFEHANKPAFWGGDKMRSFRSLRQLEQSGILEQDLFYGIVHYQVAEYFRINVTGELYVGFELLTSGTDAQKAQEINSITNGRVRQFGVFTDDHLNAPDFQSLMDALEVLETDAVCIIGLEQSINITAIPDLHAKSQQKCHIVYSGDGDNVGAAYAASLGENYVPSVGAALGALSLSGVHESFAHVRKYNISDGAELENPVFGDGVLLKNTLKATLDEFHDKGFGFIRKIQGVSGSYWDDNHTLTNLGSDYVTLNINRVSQKAVRGVRAALLPELNGTVDVDPTTGNLSVNYIEFLTSIADSPLFQMQQDGEISGRKIIIDETQNILATSKLEVTIQIVPKGISRNIEVNLEFAVSI